MNIKSPSVNKYYYIVGVVIFIIMLLLVIYIFINKDNNTTNLQSNNSLSKVIDSVRTSEEFFASLINDKTNDIEDKKITIIKKSKPVPTYTQKEEIMTPLTFENSFSKLEEQDSKEVLTATQKFLISANSSSQIKVFKKFPDNKNQKNTPEKQINIDYVAKGTNGSYPIDLSRVLTTDRNINAILINDINSSLPGKVTAQIEDNIYAAHGRNILIPIGSKAIGYYQSLSKVGESRLKIIWSRIITPKGVDIVINSEIADQMGRSGLAGEVDTRFFDKYGLAILVSTVNALAQTKVQASNPNQAVFINTYGKELSNISAKILEEKINIKPVVSIQAGSRILISPREDIWFKDIDGTIKVQTFNFNKEESL